MSQGDLTVPIYLSMVCLLNKESIFYTWLSAQILSSLQKHNDSNSLKARIQNKKPFYQALKYIYLKYVYENLLLNQEVLT